MYNSLLFYTNDLCLVFVKRITNLNVIRQNPNFGYMMKKNGMGNGPFHTGMSAVVHRAIVNYETGVLGAGVGPCIGFSDIQLGRCLVSEIQDYD